MYDLAIIIVSYKTRELLDKCLASVFSAEYPFSYRVVVVDNASDDGSAEMVIAKYPDALIVKNSENVGFSAANNQGIRKTESRHILLLNPDTELLPGALEAMLDFMDAHPKVGIAGCQLLNSDMTPQESWFSFPLPFSRYIEKKPFYPKLARALLGHRDAGPEISGEGTLRVDIVKGACLMIRRETVNRIGLLDENSFLYADDIDWCIRASRAGWENYALTCHNVIHHGCASTDQEPYITITSSRRSALYLYRKHYAAPLVAVWSLLIYSEILYKWVLNEARVRMGRRDYKTVSRRRAYRELASEIFKAKNKSKRN